MLLKSQDHVQVRLGMNDIRRYKAAFKVKADSVVKSETGKRDDTNAGS